MDLTDEAGRASTRRADPARGFLHAAAIADLPGTDTKVVFVARHETTNWKSNVSAQDQKCSPRDAA
jgi:hypothetical protein